MLPNNRLKLTARLILFLSARSLAEALARQYGNIYDQGHNYLCWNTDNMTPPKVDYYVREKFCDAVRILATGPGDVRSRLLHVWRGPLYVITPDKMPAKYRDDLIWIIGQLHRYKEDWPGQLSDLKKKEINDPTFREKYSHLYPDGVEATLHRITNKTGARIASRI